MPCLGTRLHCATLALALARALAVALLCTSCQDCIGASVVWQLLSLKLPPSPGAFGPSAMTPVTDSAADDMDVNRLDENVASADRSTRVREVSDASSEEWEQLRVDEAHTTALSPTVSQWAGSGTAPEKVLHTVAVLKVSAGGLRSGRLDITAACLYFTPEAQAPASDSANARESASGSGSEVPEEQWALDWLREVHSRRYMLRQTALELFFGDGTTAFLNFPSKEELQAAHSVLYAFKPPNVRSHLGVASFRLARGSGGPLCSCYRLPCSASRRAFLGIGRFTRGRRRSSRHSCCSDCA